MWWFAGMRQILKAWIARRGENRFGAVLEAGCGTGYMSGWLAAQYGWRMYPVDLDFLALQHGRQQGIPRMAQADIAKLPFQGESFDAVVSLDVLAHFEPGGERAALAEFRRVLRPGGTLILRLSALDQLRSRHSAFVVERQRFTREKIEFGLKSVGLELLDISYANSLLAPVAWLKFRVWEELTQQQPQSGVQMPPGWLNRMLSVPLAIEAWWLGQGWRFPLGQSLLVRARKPER